MAVLSEVVPSAVPSAVVVLLLMAAVVGVFPPVLSGVASAESVSQPCRSQSMWSRN